MLKVALYNCLRNEGFISEEYSRLKLSKPETRFIKPSKHSREL